MKNLESRIAALEQARQPAKRPVYLVTHGADETEEEIERKVQAAGRPVIVVPTVCQSAEEWGELVRRAY